MLSTRLLVGMKQCPDILCISITFNTLCWGIVMPLKLVTLTVCSRTKFCNVPHPSEIAVVTQTSLSQLQWSHQSALEQTLSRELRLCLQHKHTTQQIKLQAARWWWWWGRNKVLQLP